MFGACFLHWTVSLQKTKDHLTMLHLVFPEFTSQAYSKYLLSY